MKVRQATRKNKYTLSRILNNDFLRWLDDYFKNGGTHARV
jgi:hypothetical protein